MGLLRYSWPVAGADRGGAAVIARLTSIAVAGVFAEASALGQSASANLTQPAPALRLDVPHSHNPFNTYRATTVPAPNLANTPRIDSLVQNGVLQLSLKDA